MLASAQHPQPTAARLAELRETADRLDAETRVRGEPSHGWLARAIHDSIAAKLEENRTAFRTVAHDVETVLTSGLSGLTLNAELRARFPTTSRSDVFLGAAMAITVMEARVTLAETEMAIMRACLEAVQAENEALKAPRVA